MPQNCRETPGEANSLLTFPSHVGHRARAGQRLPRLLGRSLTSLCTWAVPCIPTQRAQRWGLSGIRDGHTSLCQKEAAVYSLARSFVTMNSKPTDKTALPVVLWEARILGKQGGHLLVSCLLPWGNWNNILFKYLSRRFCCIFLWRHKKYLITLSVI